MKNYTVEQIFKDTPGVVELFEDAIRKVGNRRGSDAITLVSAITNLEILEHLKYLKKLTEALYPKEYQKIYKNSVDEKIIDGYKEVELPEDVTLEDVKTDLKRLRKYIVMKGYTVKNFETGTKNMLVKAIKDIEKTEETKDKKE